MGMDQFQMSFTAESRRNSSKIYQDLRSCRLSSIADTEHRAQGLLEEGITKDRSKPLGDVPHVGIVGGGVAGLRCADILLQRGFKVTILEGRDRLGGRMCQAKIPNTEYLVDLGPNWIHGTDHNPILELAAETNTSTQSWTEDSQIYDEDGILVEPKLARIVNDIMWGVIIEGFRHSNENTPPIPAEKSLHDWFQENLKEIIPDMYEDGIKARLVLQLSEAWGAFIGSPVTRQSLRFFWMEETIDGENLFCAGTYKNILDRIARPAVEGAEIKYGSTVVNITSLPESGSKVTVETSKNEKYAFDEVVMTAPLGWLKKHKNIFSPPLPERLAKAIDNIGYGKLDKVYITFPKAFWEHHEGFTQWLSPKYSTLNPKRWNQESLECSTLPDGFDHPTLLFYIFGEQSTYISELLAKSPSSEHHTYLSQFFEPYFSLLPGYDAESADCRPVASLATDWVADDLAGNGSYSNFEVGLEEGDKDIIIMRNGLPGRGIWFAGEHTAPFVGLGTVTGAYWSGESVGRRIWEGWGIVSQTGLTMSEKVPVPADETRMNGEKEKAKEVNIRGFADIALGEYGEDV